MRLSKIKLAGFKSFVDPTTIYLPSELIGVVGPNGCGKSNVIDAVRWVMGESSARHLRGDSMADVVFNGSSARKPVGSASVELFFDNSEGAVGGQYARYNEIAIRRVVSRDGISNYYLNNTRCRRKDITGLFLGTGLGARSYSIIEQGMISRLIEAKPEELRVFLEEAAGISRYKERRRETENRIVHTKENLSRLNDLRDEIEKLIKHLQHQARAAERYKKLKEDERRVTAEVLALRIRGLQERIDAAQARLRERDTALESAVAELRSIEAAIEKARESHAEESERLGVVQSRFYQSGAEIARVEQSIQHRRELRQHRQQELGQASQGLEDLVEHVDRDASLLSEIDGALGTLEPELDTARGAEQASNEELRAAESGMQAWQQAWDAFNEQAGAAQRTAHVESARIEQLETQLVRLERQRERLRSDRDALSTGTLDRELDELAAGETDSQARLAGLEGMLESMLEQMHGLRKEDGELTRQLDEARGEQQAATGRMASLSALQQAALGQADGGANTWLARLNLGARPRLAQLLEVDPGWETAVETVLGDYLEAVCVNDLDEVIGELGDLGPAALTLVTTGPAAELEVESGTGIALADRVRGAGSCSRLLEGVTAVETLPEARERRRALGNGESVVTRDGAWVGADWVRVSSERDQRSGVIAREGELRRLREDTRQAKAGLARLEESQIETRTRLKQLEDARDARQAELGAAHREHAGLRARLDTCQSQVSQIHEQIGAFERSSSDVEQEIRGVAGQLAVARQRLQEAQAGMTAAADRRAALVAERNELEQRLATARERAHADREAAHRLTVQIESRRSSRESATVSLERMQTQRQRFAEQMTALEQQILADEAPMGNEQSTLEAQLRQRVVVESALAEARRLVDAAELRVRELSQERAEREIQVDEARARVEENRMQARELTVRREGLDEQFEATGLSYASIGPQLPPEAVLEDWDEQLARLARRIDRLGPINLAAIDEFREQSERKAYLDAQYADLNEALDTLESAIQKIDRETRTRFRETFDKVNGGLKTMFPRLFGGGHAYLELTGEDMLSAGVTVMARPPGKRNSNIHLLSGGEKALTAVAMVFAIFALNPAPFCLLDEVDAPLDDANVGRFCDLVREMSGRVQFVFITHNKTTMEMARQLIGVTMSEPGVSRLVAVDVDEAVQLVAM